MTCKDCINFEWCKSQNSEKISYYDGLSCMENKCHGFKNKSQYIKLPCKVGDTVYINAWFGKAVPHVVKKIGSVYIQTDDERHHGSTADFYADDFGKSVFLTREEAEKALGEVKENE